MLDRTFDEILFVRDIKLIESSVEDTTATLTMPALSDSPQENMQMDPVAPPENIEVLPLEGGMTIAAIFAEHGQIEGQVVKLRAKVTKFSANILGKNWVTLQDGTGTAPDNVLVATSSETVAVDDEVVVKGKVKNNVDIGAGYAYKVLLEEAGFE